MPPEERNQEEPVKDDESVKEATPTEEELAINLEYIQPQHEPTYYVNNAQFAYSHFDLRIDFGELQRGDAKTKTIFSAHKARLIFSWPFAKTFLSVLKKQIDNYEKNVAPIPDRPKIF